MAIISLIRATGWKPPLISKKKLLKLPELDVAVEVKDDDISVFGPEGKSPISDYKKRFATFKKTLETEFDRRFSEFSQTRFAAIQAAMDDLEIRLVAKSKADAEALVEGANAMLKKACLTWEGELAALGDEAVNAALSQFLKSLRRPIIKAKARCVAKIIIKGVFSVATGLMDVAKDIKAGDAKAALKDFFSKVLVPFAKVAYDEYKQNWPTVNNVARQIEQHIKELHAALAALAKHDQDYESGGDVSNLDALFNEAVLCANNLGEQMQILDGLVVHYVLKLAEQRKQLERLEREVDDPDAKQKLKECRARSLRANNLLAKITEQKSAVAAMQKELADHKRPTNVGGIFKVLITGIAESRKGMQQLSTALAAIKSLNLSKMTN